MTSWIRCEFARIREKKGGLASAFVSVCVECLCVIKSFWPKKINKSLSLSDISGSDHQGTGTNTYKCLQI